MFQPVIRHYFSDLATQCNQVLRSFEEARFQPQPLEPMQNTVDAIEADFDSQSSLNTQESPAGSKCLLLAVCIWRGMSVLFSQLEQASQSGNQSGVMAAQLHAALSYYQETCQTLASPEIGAVEQLALARSKFTTSQKGTEGPLAVLEPMLNKFGEIALQQALGQPFTWKQYKGLSQVTDSPAPLNIHGVAPTKSGSLITLVDHLDRKGKVARAVFKGGLKSKLKQERQGIKIWHRRIPGLAPRIIKYSKQGKQASILLEKLEGDTFDRLLLDGRKKHFEQGLELLVAQLHNNWSETLKQQPVPASFVAQIDARLAKVFDVFPELNQTEQVVGKAKVPAFTTLLQQARTCEAQMVCPISVLVHGDLNADNILVDHDQKDLHFVDLHRTGQADYLQDVTVFMVSCFRLGGSGKEFRHRVATVASQMTALADSFAKQQGDSTFAARLQLGLARSFITSARFARDKNFASELFLRGQFLLQTFAGLKADKIQSIKLQHEKLFYA